VEIPLLNINNRFKNSRSKLTKNLTIRALMKRLAKLSSKRKSQNLRLRLMHLVEGMQKESAIEPIINLSLLALVIPGLR